MLKEKRHISVTDCDYKGRVRPDYYLVVFGELATRDAVNTGIYNEEMIGHYGWVVVKQTLKLSSSLYDQDDIDVTTIPAKSSPAVFNRFYIVDREEQRIAECYSNWTIIDLDKRSIARAKDAGVNYTSDVKMPDRPKTLKPLNDYDQHATYTVRYSDTDTNNHMNNTRYARLATDLIDYDYLGSHILAEMSINYRIEIPAKCTFDIDYKQDGNHFYFKGRRDNEICFLIEMIYRDAYES